MAADEVVLRFATQGTQGAVRDVDRLRQGVHGLGADTHASGVQAESGLLRISGGLTKVSSNLGFLSTANPVLGQFSAGLDHVAGKLHEVDAGAGGAGGTLRATLASGANIATVALLATAAVGVKSFVSQTAAVRAFQRVSGATAEEASKLVFATGELGISSTTAARAVFFLGRNVEKNAAGLEKYGVTIARNKNGTVNLSETLFTVSDAYNKLTDQTQRNTLVQAAFGRGGLQLIPVLERGRDGIDELFRAAGASGQIFSQDQLEQGREFGLVMHEVESAGKGLTIALGEGAVPVLTDFAKVLVPVINFLGQSGVLSGVLAGLLVSKLVSAVTSAGGALVRYVTSLSGARAAELATAAAADAEAGAHVAQAASLESLAGVQAAYGAEAAASVGFTEAQILALTGAAEAAIRDAAAQGDVVAALRLQVIASTEATGGALTTAAALEAEAVASEEAAAGSLTLDTALGGLPLVIGAVVTGITLFTLHHKDAKQTTDDFRDAILKDTDALTKNTDAIGENSIAVVKKRIVDHDQVDDLRRAGVSLDDFTQGISGSSKDLLTLINRFAKAGEFGPAFVKGFKSIDDAQRSVIQGLGEGVPKNAGLLKSILALSGGYEKGTQSAKDLVAIGGESEDALDGQTDSAGKLTTALEKAAAAGQTFSTIFDQFTTVISTQQAFEDANKKLGQVIAGEDQAKEHAQKLIDLQKAQLTVTRATEARRQAEQKLAEVNKRNLAEEIERANVERERAGLSLDQATKDQADAAEHLRRVQEAGATPSQVRDAQLKLRDAQIKVAEATDAKADAEKSYNDVASGAALERDRAAAILDVRDARIAETDAQQKLKQAFIDAQQPAADLAQHIHDINDQLLQVFSTLEKSLGAQVTAGIITPREASQQLLLSLNQLETQHPEVKTQIEAIKQQLISIGAIKITTGAHGGGQAVYPQEAGGDVQGGRRYLVGEEGGGQGAEVLDLFPGARGYIHPHRSSVTQAVLRGASDGTIKLAGTRQTGGFVGTGTYGVPGVRASDQPRVVVVEASVSHETNENFNGPVLAKGLTLAEVRREQRQDARRRAQSRGSRGKR